MGVVLEIKYLKDCFDGHSYFGYKNNNQYTDGYDDVEDLRSDNPEFDGVQVTYNSEKN